jgi:hypothetical protein
MGTPVIVMIITLAMPNGDASVQVKPMQTAAHCRAAADLEAADPFVASVECSELSNGRLELEFRPHEQDSNYAARLLLAELIEAQDLRAAGTLGIRVIGSRRRSGSRDLGVRRGRRLI